MFTNKFATRLNSFKSNWELDTKPTIQDLIKRASKVKGLTHVDLNFPDHSEPSVKEISKYTNDCGLEINGLAMRYYTNPAFKSKATPICPIASDRFGVNPISNTISDFNLK